MSKMRPLYAVICILVTARVAPAQVNLRSETDSIEAAALRYAKANLGDVTGTIALDSRIRTAHGFAHVRGMERSRRLADMIGATVVDFGCDHTKRTCRAPKVELGLLLQAPIVKGDMVHITVEMHMRSGMGTDTYELARAGKGWWVRRIVRRSAT